MSKILSRSILNASLFIRAIAASCVIILAVAASPRLGTEDIPELPMADGSGDTPEMFIDLFSSVGKKEQIKLSSLRGRVVLLDFFYSKCPHCEEHAPHMTQIYEQYRQRGFTVMGLATDRPDKKDHVESVKNFVTKAKITYPVGFLTTEIIAYYMDSHNHGVPQMVLFGPDGKMVKREIGWSPKIEKEMREAIEAQLAKLPTVKPGSKASAKPTQGKAKQG
jgi:peroxiredoxin